MNPLDPECICEGNWRNIFREVSHLFGKKFIHSEYGEYILQGLMVGEDDYYYVLGSLEGQPTYYGSCVGDLETHGFELVE